MTTPTLPARLLACAETCDVYSPDQCATLIDGIGWIAMRHMLREAAAALSGREGRCKTVIVYGDRGPEEREPVEDYYTTPPPGGGVVVPDALLAEVRKLCSWKHLMSYNDSYFGEPSGELKSTVYAIERALPAAPSAKGVGNV